MNRRLLLSLIAGMVLTLSGRPFAQHPPATSAPKRIISLVPATTEMLFGMGAGSRLVGVGSYDRFPPEVDKLPKLGGLLDPNIEQLIALRPDLVVVYDTQKDLKQRLERANIPMWGYRLTELADVTTTVRALGERAGLSEPAETLARSIASQLNTIRTRVAGKPRPRTLLLFGREPGSLRAINASGGYGFLHDLVELAGGSDVLSDVKQAAVPMSSEMVLTRAPDIIIELHYGEPWPESRLETERKVWSALPSVPAVRNGRVSLLTGDQFVVPGPRVVQAAEQLARVLHPEAFR